MRDVKISHEIGPEWMEPTISNEMVLKDGTAALKAGTIKQGGFVCCTASLEYEPV